MPTLMLRGLSSETMACIKAYARREQTQTSVAAAQLLTIALDHLDARSAGAATTNAKPKRERSESARHAAQARWNT